MPISVVKPPQRPIYNQLTVFLAGSIEMGKAENWQEEVINKIELNRMAGCIGHSGITILNPRRDDWDASWSQNYENAQFYQQVNWELEGLENSDYVFMYLSPGTMSPISLLELGMMSHTEKMIVVCPYGFQRKGNVDLVCSRYKIPCFNTLDEGVKHLCQVLQASLRG